MSDTPFTPLSMLQAEQLLQCEAENVQLRGELDTLRTAAIDVLKLWYTENTWKPGLSAALDALRVALEGVSDEG